MLLNNLVLSESPTCTTLISKQYVLIIIIKVKFQKAIIVHPQIVYCHFSSMTINILKLL
uniref:Uncharacterized protein n=1 Tax=Arundo donax TaxID=35708 RepID=A0A0A9CHG0_ARUDO